MRREPSFGDGAALIGWLVILFAVLAGFVGILASFDALELAAGSVGALIVIIAVACGAEWGPKDDDGHRIYKGWSQEPWRNKPEPPEPAPRPIRDFHTRDLAR